MNDFSNHDIEAAVRMMAANLGSLNTSSLHGYTYDPGAVLAVGLQAIYVSIQKQTTATTKQTTAINKLTKTIDAILKHMQNENCATP